MVAKVQSRCGSIAFLVTPPRLARLHRKIGHFHPLQNVPVTLGPDLYLGQALALGRHH